MQENTRPKTDQSKLELLTLITRRKIEENRAAHYEKRAREIEEENRRKRIDEENQQKRVRELGKKHQDKRTADAERRLRLLLMIAENYMRNFEEEKRRLEEAAEKTRIAKQRMMVAKQNAAARKTQQPNQPMRMAMGKGHLGGNVGR